MSATDELRRMLDERGVEYETNDAQVSDTEWYYVTKLRDGYSDRWVYEEPPDCDLLVSYQYDLGAEDAIAATLGTGQAADEWGEGFRAGCDAANKASEESVEHYKVENAKLRELARGYESLAATLCDERGCDGCPFDSELPVCEHMRLVACLRELGADE